MRAIYLCHPIAGDVEANVAEVERIYNELWERWGLQYPVAPYLLSLKNGTDDDSDPHSRARGLQIDSDMVKRCDEVWLFGPKISSGLLHYILVVISCSFPVISMTTVTQAYLRRVMDGWLSTYWPDARSAALR